MASSPNSPSLGAPERLAEVIESCTACELACVACADACLGEAGIRELRECMRLDLDCADLCAATARILSRSFEWDRLLAELQLNACRHACGRCGDECARHAEHHPHCGICAAECRKCEAACAALLRELDDGEA